MTSSAKALVASGTLLGLMGLAWFTLEADKIRTIVLIVLGLFLFRVVMHALRSRYDE
jgi:hypothetical protein